MNAEPVPATARDDGARADWVDQSMPIENVDSRSWRE